MSHDAWAVDETHIYNYSEERGLTRAIQDSQGSWERVVSANRDMLGLKSVAMVCVNGRLLMRHSGLTDRPVVVIDCDTLLEAPESEQITSVGPTSLNWSITPVGDRNWHMTATPLAYDGKYLYGISTHRD